jgi:hypothetical protein
MEEERRMEEAEGGTAETGATPEGLREEGWKVNYDEGGEGGGGEEGENNADVDALKHAVGRCTTRELTGGGSGAAYDSTILVVTTETIEEIAGKFKFGVKKGGLEVAIKMEGEEGIDCMLSFRLSPVEAKAEEEAGLNLYSLLTSPVGATPKVYKLSFQSLGTGLILALLESVVGVTFLAIPGKREAFDALPCECKFRDEGVVGVAVEVGEETWGGKGRKKGLSDR